MEKMDDPTQYKFLIKYVVHDGYIRVLAKGASAKAILAIMSVRLQEALVTWESELGTLSAVAAAAFAELKDVNMVVGMLAGAVAPTTAGLDAVMTSNSGGRQHLRNAITCNVACWAKEEGRLRGLCVAKQTFVPEIEKLLKKLAKISLKELAEQVAPRVPVWQDAMPEGALGAGEKTR